MRPAAHQGHILHLVVARIAIHMQVPLESDQKISRMLAATGTLVVVDHRWLYAPARAIQPHVRVRLRRFTGFFQHLQRGFIRMQHFLF